MSLPRTLRVSLWAPLALVLFGFCGIAQAAEQGEGHNKAQAPHDQAWLQNKTKTCAGCHGENGVSKTPNFPSLAGQYKNYLVHSLKAYRDDSRKNPIMGAQAKGLTDAQIKALAEYYSAQEPALYTPSLGD